MSRLKRIIARMRQERPMSFVLSSTSPTTATLLDARLVQSSTVSCEMLRGSCLLSHSRLHSLIEITSTIRCVRELDEIINFKEAEGEYACLCQRNQRGERGWLSSSLEADC